MAIDTTKLPPVLPVSVARTVQDGLPSKPLIDWEQYSRDWYEKTAVDLDTRLTDVRSDTDDAHARITTETTARTTADSAFASQITTITADVGANSASIVLEATARANADSALASQITTVSASIGPAVSAEVAIEATARAAADSAFAGQLTTVSAQSSGATAGGAVYLIAETAPSGYSAQYGWYLTAGNKRVGMAATLDNAGNAGIAYTASQFSLTDPSYNGGAPNNVFAYSSGIFTFNVPVRVGTTNFFTNSVTNWFNYLFAADLTLGAGSTDGNGAITQTAYTFTVDANALVIYTVNALVFQRGAFGQPCRFILRFNVDGVDSRTVYDITTVNSTGITNEVDKTIMHQVPAGTHTVRLNYIYDGSDASSIGSVLAGSAVGVVILKR